MGSQLRNPDATRPRSPWPALAAAVGFAAALAVLAHLALHTHTGQLADDIGRRGVWIGRRHVIDLVHSLLGLVSVLSVAGATLVVAAVALARGRRTLAVCAAALIAGANLSTQLLKHVLLSREHLLPGVSSASTPNSLPSGHTTVAMSVAVAVTMVVPHRARGTAAVVGGMYAAATAVATLTAGWHRPSDALAAFLVVGAWSALACAALAMTQRARPRRTSFPARPATPFLALVGTVVLGIGAAGLTYSVANPPTIGHRHALMLSYFSGASCVVGTGLLVMALILALFDRFLPAAETR